MASPVSVPGQSHPSHARSFLYKSFLLFLFRLLYRALCFSIVAFPFRCHYTSFSSPPHPQFPSPPYLDPLWLAPAFPHRLLPLCSMLLWSRVHVCVPLLSSSAPTLTFEVELHAVHTQANTYACTRAHPWYSHMDHFKFK